MVGLKPIVCVEKGDCLRTLRDGIVAANQARRITVISVIPGKQHVGALKIRDFGRLGAITYQDVSRRDRLCLYALMSMAKP